MKVTNHMTRTVENLPWQSVDTTCHHQHHHEMCFVQKTNLIDQSIILRFNIVRHFRHGPPTIGSIGWLSHSPFTSMPQPSLSQLRYIAISDSNRNTILNLMNINTNLFFSLRRTVKPSSTVHFRSELPPRVRRLATSIPFFFTSR